MTLALLFIWIAVLTIAVFGVRADAESAQQTADDATAEIESTDDWLGLGTGGPVNNSLDEVIADALIPLKERICALEPASPPPAEEPWETWLRESKVRQYNRLAKACGCFECVAFGHSGPCTNPKADDYRFVEADYDGSEASS